MEIKLKEAHLNKINLLLIVILLLLKNKYLLNEKIEPLIIGNNPSTGKPIYYYSDGRYGPYISSNRVNVSVKEQPLLEEAIDLINNKKTTKKFFKKKA